MSPTVILLICIGVFIGGPVAVALFLNALVKDECLPTKEDFDEDWLTALGFFFILSVWFFMGALVTTMVLLAAFFAWYVVIPLLCVLACITAICYGLYRYFLKRQKTSC